MKVFMLEMRQNAKSLLIWTLVVAAVAILFMAFYPSMQSPGMVDLSDSTLEGIPTVLLEAFGLAQIPDFSQIDQYFGYVFQFILLGGAFFAALLGSRTFIREESEGTIEFLYSQPITRNNIYFGKLLAALLSLLIFLVAISAVHIMMVVLFADGNYGEILWKITISFLGFAFTTWIYFSLGIFFSTIFPHYKQAVPFAIGLVFLTYLFGVVSAFADSAAFLAYLSPIYYSLPNALMAEGFNWWHLLIGSAVSILSLVFGGVIYRHKDFKL